jgi:hypothetical protein
MASSVSSRPFSQESLQDEYNVGHDLVQYLRDYAREKPEVAMLWCFGIGFILGWKLKPW